MLPADIVAQARAAGRRSDLARVLRALLQRETLRCGGRLSYRQIADRSGLSLGAVGSYLNGSRLPADERFDRLLEVLGADATERDALIAARQRLADVADAGPSWPPDIGAAPRALPSPAAGFTGRNSHLARLDELLNARTRPAGCVAITGMPGVGKTALALQWALRAAHHFPGGQIYVDLHAYSVDPPLSVMDSLGVMLAAFGVDLRGVPDLAARSLRYQSLLRGRSALVLLDNVGSAEQVRPLLPPPPCVAVVTSRDELVGLDEIACRVALDPLSRDEALELLRLLVGDRVDREPAVARTLAARCGYLPLALRVAAEHAAGRPHTSLAELLDELAEHTGALEAFAIPGDERADLRRVFSWSVLRLPEPPGRAFWLLGLIPGLDVDRYGLAALAAVSPAEADDLAGALVGAHLLQPRPGDRFAMHDLLRAYAAEAARTRVSTADYRAAVGRLLAHYVRTTTMATDLMFPTHRHVRPGAAGHDAAAIAGPELADARAAAAWLAAERVNLVRAGGYAASNGWAREAVTLALALGRYLEDLHYDDALAVHVAAAAAADRLGGECGSAERAAVWTGLGLAQWRLGHAERAARHLESAFEHNRAAGNTAAAARTMAALGVVLEGQGRYRQALACYQRGLDLARSSGVPVQEAIALSNVASGYLRVEEYQTAHDLWEQARQITEEAGESWPLGAIREGLAMALIGLGRYEEALAQAERSVAMYRSFAQVVYRLRSHAAAGLALRGLGRYPEAVDELTAALRECREHGNPRPTSLVLNTLGEVWNDLGDARRAVACHTEAMALADHHSNMPEHTRARVGMGDAYAACGDLDRARRSWQQALDVYHAAGVPAANRVRARLAGLDSP